MENETDIGLDCAFVVKELPFDRSTPFAIKPDAKVLVKIADLLGLQALRKVRFSGSVSPLRKSDWSLEADIGATIEQACVVSGDPVVTRIDKSFRRDFLIEFAEEIEEGEVEMQASEHAMPLTKKIDVIDAMLEALAINVPDYPRRPDLGDQIFKKSFAPPGIEAISDADLKPFAGLSKLKQSMQTPGDKD